ncbi:UNVERIFIED_CONTAM: Glycine-rich RNA-binding protein 8 [Sesamum calycinum]|uniref:Glycine-rich RNA-binding protein 8 n=1 Tax=Sesamum calycinum TaxID=2727403 RepID=A0AAW2Q5F0_9LAMI
MDVGSPGNGYDTINDFLKDDDTALPDDLDVGFIVNKDIVDDDVYSDSGVNDKSHLDLSEKEKPVLPSLSSTFRHYDVPGSPSEKVLESGFHHDTLDKSDNVGPEMQQYILDKPASPANADIDEHTYVEAVQNESAQSGCVSRDTDEGVPMHQTEKLCISPVSPLRDPGTNSHKVHESINSSRGCKYLAPSHFDKKYHGSSPEPPKSNKQISSPTNKQTPSPTVPNQVDPPHAEPRILASSHGMELMSQHIENPPAEHVITSPSSHYRVNGEMLQSSVRRQKSSCVHKADYRNKSYSRSSRHSKGCKKRSHDLGPSMSHSLRSEKLCPLQMSHSLHMRSHEPLSSKSSEQKHASKSPTPQDQPLKSQNSSASQGGVVVLPSSLSRLSRQKPGSARRSNHRRSSSRSLHIGCGHKDLLDASLSVDRCSRSHKVSSSGEGDTQFPSSSRSVEQKNICSMTPHRSGSRSRSPHTRYHHKRSCDTAQTEQLSQRKKLFALQGPVPLSSLSRSGKQKHKLDDKSTSSRLLSMSPHNGDHHKTSSFHADSSAGRLHSRQKESAPQGDHGPPSCSRLRSNRLGSVETYKRKRSQSRSPCTGDNKRSTRAHQPSSSQKVSAPHESLLQPYESAERHNLGLCSINPAEPTHSASPWSSRQRPKNSSSAKGAPELHRNNCTRHNHRHRGRSVSPLHIRRKDFSRESKVDIRKRSLSKSPGRRDSGKFPRERHRSPPSYHSLRSTPRRTHWSPPHDRSTGLGKPGRGLFVAGFSFITTERDLERKFSRFGRVRDVRIVRDKRSGDSRGFGFLTLERDEQADAAIRALDKTEWDGRIVLVEKSKSH